jgi:hypothetical protein
MVPPSGPASTTARRDSRPGVVGWIALVLGALYVALLWFAWWNESQARREPRVGEATAPWLEQWSVLTHLLPAVVLLAALVLAWRWPIIGAVAFLGYALVTVATWFPEWIYAPLVTIPPLIVGVLFLADALLRRRGRGRTTTA